MVLSYIKLLSHSFARKTFYQAQLEIQAQHVSEHNGYHYVYHIRSVKQNTLFIFEFGFVWEMTQKSTRSYIMTKLFFTLPLKTLSIYRAKWTQVVKREKKWFWILNRRLYGIDLLMKNTDQLFTFLSLA